MQQNQSQNPMAVEPVPKLMARIGLPIVLSMILQAAYNVVDSAYLARMATGGETALTALSLAFPVQLFMVAVSIGTGVGTNALLARLLGLGDKDRADAAVGNAQFLALVISAVFMLFSAVGVVPYVNSQSAGGSIERLPIRSATTYYVAAPVRRHGDQGPLLATGAAGAARPAHAQRAAGAAPQGSGTAIAGARPRPAGLGCALG